VKVNPISGCDECGNCEPICAPPCANTATAPQCPNGFVRENNCPICQCNPCPDISQCAQTLQCTNGYAVDSTTGCKKCECAKPTCPDLSACTPCTNGFSIDPATGCTTCKCNTCAKPNCTNTTPCRNGVYLDKTTLCPTCECLPGCQNFCPNGYDFADATSTGSAICKCICPANLYCNTDCGLEGHKIDAYGCKLCECNPTFNNCSKVACDLYCELGYVLDANKCPTCKCLEKPTVCPAYACAVNCLYGTLKDATGCPSCNCNPCSTEILCSRACLYGFAKSATGCQSCTCNDAPVCPTGANVDTTTCPLDCVKGLQIDNGCTYCKCSAVEPCKCEPAPADYKPLLCADGVTFIKYTDVCERDATGKCSLALTKCPIGIEITLSKGLTNDEILAIKTKLGITNDDDFVVTKETNVDGGVTYTMWVQKDGIPASVTANDVKTTAENEAKASDPNAIALVISDGSTMAPNSFGHFLAPIFGLLSVVVLFF